MVEPYAAGPTLAAELRRRLSHTGYYLPVPANSWYESWIAPIQSDIGPALQACATPGLFYDAAIGSNLGQALAALFAAVTQSGHLTQ